MVLVLGNPVRLRLEERLQGREHPLHSRWSYLKQQEIAALVGPLERQVDWVLTKVPRQGRNAGGGRAGEREA